MLVKLVAANSPPALAVDRGPMPIFGVESDQRGKPTGSNITMAHTSLHRGGPIVRIDRPEPVTVRSGLEAGAAAQEIMPVIDALLAVGDGLEHDQLDAAWVELDNAELELRCQEGRAMTPQPALGKALGAVERARESMAMADVGRASADIGQAISALRRL